MTKFKVGNINNSTTIANYVIVNGFVMLTADILLAADVTKDTTIITLPDAIKPKDSTTSIMMITKTSGSTSENMIGGTIKSDGTIIHTSGTARNRFAFRVTYAI